MDQIDETTRRTRLTLTWLLHQGKRFVPILGTRGPGHETHS